MVPIATTASVAMVLTGSPLVYTAMTFDADVAFTRQVVSTGDESLVTGRDLDAENSLWLVTAEEILPVPLDGTSSFGRFVIDDLAVAAGRVIIGDGNDVFVGDMAYLTSRAQDEGALLGDPVPLATPSGPPEPDVYREPGQDVEPIFVEPAPPRPTSVAQARPTVTAQPVLPQPTAAQPTPTRPPPTAAPSAPTAIPVPQMTPSCTSSFDADAGSITLSCTTETFETS